MITSKKQHQKYTFFGYKVIKGLQELQMRFYSRETNRGAFCVIQQMSIEPPFPSVQLK